METERQKIQKEEILREREERERERWVGKSKRQRERERVIEKEIVLLNRLKRWGLGASNKFQDISPKQFYKGQIKS